MMNWLLKLFIKKYDIISFDVFDTLIERDVRSPSDIFRLVGKEILGNDESENFWNDRRKAEKEARMKKSGEVNFDEIYEQLDNKYVNIKDRLKSAELRWELDLCHIKKRMKPIFDYAVLNKKTIYLISDMYLPYSMIERILKQCNIYGYEKLYISNEYNKNKITGSLFQVVIKEHNLDRKNMLHIGDSIKADFVGARKAGLHTFLIGRKNCFGRIFRRR